MSESKVIKFKIQDYDDRKHMVVALSHAGYKVWVEAREGRYLLSGDTYYVCVEMKRSTPEVQG